MQIFSQKNILFLSLYLFCHILYAQSTIKSYSLQKADSLFAQKQYADAFVIYEQSFKQTGLISAQRVLQMAFIAEGLGDYTKTLYYLSLYYHLETNRNVLLKIEKIAQEHQLKGYEYSDVDFLKSFYFRYTSEIYTFCIIISILFFVFLALRLRRRKRLKNTFFISFFIFLLLIWMMIYATQETKKVVIEKESTYLMKAPSAGAEVFKVIEKGHRLAWRSTQDIWLEVVWDNQIGYVKKTDVLLLDF